MSPSFIRPAASSSWFDQEDTMEWGTCEDEQEPPVPGHPDPELIPHPSSSPRATPLEAHHFWLEGGWDE